MGIGKNHVGEKLAKHLHCEFFDGDTVIPKTMMEKVTKFKSLNTADIDNYIYSHFIPEIGKRSQGKDLVVAQALYRQSHRDTIEFFFGEENVKFVWLPVFSNAVHIKRLYGRKNGIRWTLYGLYNKLFFQEPEKSTYKVINNNDHDNENYLKFQMENLF